MEREEARGQRIYLIKETDKSYVAEAVFVNRTPRSRVLLDIVRALEQRIKREGPEHPAYLPYADIKQIEGDYCLLFEGERPLTPVTAYLRDEAPSLDKITDWALSLLELCAEAEEEGLNWAGYNLRSLRVDELGEIRMADPEIEETISGYRGDQEMMAPSEIFYPPEVLQGAEWDTKSRIYSLGIVLYFLFTGRQPYRSVDKAALLDEIIHSAPVEPAYLNNNISQRLNNFIMRMIDNEQAQRPADWETVLTELKEINDQNEIWADSDEKKRIKARSARVIKSHGRKQGLGFFLRKQGKVLVGSILVVLVLGYLIFSGGSPSEVTKNTPPEQVVEMFYHSLDKKDLVLMADTTIVDLKKLQNTIAQISVIEKMNSVYSQEADNILAVSNLDITSVTDPTQPVFQVEYLLLLNQGDRSSEIGMRDIVRMGNVEGRWQIVEFAGDIELVINGQMTTLQKDAGK